MHYPKGTRHFCVLQHKSCNTTRDQHLPTTLCRRRYEGSANQDGHTTRVRRLVGAVEAFPFPSHAIQFESEQGARASNLLNHDYITVRGHSPKPLKLPETDPTLVMQQAPSVPRAEAERPRARQLREERIKGAPAPPPTPAGPTQVARLPRACPAPPPPDQDLSSPSPTGWPRSLLPPERVTPAGTPHGTQAPS